MVGMLSMQAAAKTDCKDISCIPIIDSYHKYPQWYFSIYLRFEAGKPLIEKKPSVILTSYCVT